MDNFESVKDRNPFEPEKADLRKVTGLIRSLQEEAINPMGGDIYVRAFCRATIPELMEGGKLRPHMEEIFSFRRRHQSYFPEVYAGRILMRAVEKQALKYLPPDIYPVQFSKEAAWKNELYDGALQYDELAEDIVLRNIQSNIPERYKSFALVTHLFKDRLGQAPTVLDVGDSLNLGLKKWKTMAENPFRATRAIRPVHGERYLGHEFEEDHEASEKIEQLLNRAPNLGLGFGFDIQPIPKNDPEAYMWGLACSFRPGELIFDNRRVKEFRTLSQSDIPGIVTYQRPVDVRDAESLDQVKEFLPGNKADLVTCSTVFYQLTGKQIFDALRNLKELCHDGSLIVINDFVQRDHKVANGMKFYQQNRWVQPYTFRTLIVDPADLENPPVELFRFNNGRAEHVWLSEYGKSLLDRA